MPVRWLHLSDIHESTSDAHLRKRMYNHIVDEVARRRKPDLIFLTGDLAFSGTDDEYGSLEKHFIDPLKAALPGCPIFAVPGNHDVDRNRGASPRSWVGQTRDSALFQAVDSKGAKFRKDALFPRFEDYAALSRCISAWGGDWLQSAEGTAQWSGTVNGHAVAIVGLNTAWLSQDNDDWGKLTPGREMVQQALEKAAAAKPDLLIVLGHHPLGALSGDGDDSDGERVRLRLAQYNALYLHGHRHRNSADRIGYAARDCLSIQAPSAYQANDDRRWRNGILWCDAEPASGEIIIQPRMWNEDNREYNWDTAAGYEADKVPEREGFRLSLPGRTAAADAPARISLPSGWQVIDRSSLAEIRAQPPATDEMIGFFDGETPTWGRATAHGVEPRQIVEKIASRFRAIHASAARPLVVLLTGAGGEGKSTAALHVAASLVDQERQTWTCVHHHAAFAPLPAELLQTLPTMPNHAWLVLIDDADTKAREILAAAKRLASRTDVHFLLVAREAEWRLKVPAPGMWEPEAQFVSVVLSGLTETDAGHIVAGWHAWDNAAADKLDGNAAIENLVRESRETAVHGEEGELLGALLAVRQGDDMKAHVAKLVRGLGKKPVIGTFSLQRIYCMIAAMHAANQLYLTRSVLAFALGCAPEKLEESALQFLRREAKLSMGATFILVRHRRIAEAACAVMREEGVDVDGDLPFLARAARKHFLARKPTPKIAAWNSDLAQYFVDKGEETWPLARNIAKAVYDAEPTNRFLLTAYASILRRIGEPAAAMTELKKSGAPFIADRAFVYDWSTVAGLVGDHGLGIWLAGHSLADTDAKTPLDPRRCELSLVGIGVACQELGAKKNNPLFLKALAACGQLGSRLADMTPRSRTSFESYAAAAARHNLADVSIEQAVEAIRLAIVKGSEAALPENDFEHFERLLLDPGGYHYSVLEHFFKKLSADAARLPA